MYKTKLQNNQITNLFYSMSDKDKENINKPMIISNKINFFHIYNRTYKLVAAVFVVVNLIDSDNDLRQRIERLALDIMSLCVNLKEANEQNSLNLNRDIEKNILEIMSLIDIASLSGLVSAMNGSILKQEFQAFLSELEMFMQSVGKTSSVSIENILKTDFVDTSRVDSSKLEKDTNMIPDSGASKNLALGQSNVLYVGQDKGHKRKDTRKNLIFEYLEKHQNASIRDIVPNIRGCSEKTVQRELIDLIKEGKIRKTGERRWSRYSII